MKDATTRLYAIEHPLMMVIAIVLLTMARSKTKNLSDVSAHKKNLLFFVLALVAIVSRIPWDQWLNNMGGYLTKDVKVERAVLIGIITPHQTEEQAKNTLKSLTF